MIFITSKKKVVGESIGKVMWINLFTAPAPSIWADSRASFCTFCKPAKKKMMLYPRFFQVAAAVTTTRASVPFVSQGGFIPVITSKKWFKYPFAGLNRNRNIAPEMAGESAYGQISKDRYTLIPLIFWFSSTAISSDMVKPTITTATENTKDEVKLFIYTSSVNNLIKLPVPAKIFFIPNGCTL